MASLSASLVRSKSHFSRVEARRALERIIKEQMDQLENSSPWCHVMRMELEGTGGHWRAPPPSSPRARVIPDNEWAPLLLCKILRDGGTKQARVHAGVQWVRPSSENHKCQSSPQGRRSHFRASQVRLSPAQHRAHGSSHIISVLLGLLTV